MGLLPTVFVPVFLPVYPTLVGEYAEKNIFHSASQIP